VENLGFDLGLVGRTIAENSLIIISEILAPNLTPQIQIEVKFE